MENIFNCVAYLYVSLYVTFISVVIAENDTNITPTVCVRESNLPYEWTVDTFPNPMVDIGKCGRNCKKSWICDPNNLINPFQADYLDKKIEEIRARGRCACWNNCETGDQGFKISIALLPKVQIFGGGKASETTVKAFARQIREKWNFESCGEDILILISRDDRKIFTNVGTTAEQKLSYDCSEGVYLRARSKLSAGEFADGLDYIMDSYRSVLETGDCDQYNMSTFTQEEKSNSSELPNWAVILIIFGSIFGFGGLIFIIIFMCLKCCGCRGGGGGRSSSGWSRGHWGGGSFSFGGDGGGGGGGGGDGGGDF